MEIDCALTGPQQDFALSEAQFPSFVGGYGAGKSEALITRLLLLKLKYPTLDVGYFAPTFDLIRLIAWPRWCAKLDEWGIGYRLNKSEKVLHVATGGQVIFRTLETPERIVGFAVADAGIDELDTLQPDHAQDAWNKVIARCRQKKPDGALNTAAVATTPEGFRVVYRMWQRDPQPGYALYRAPTRSNPFLPAEYIEQLRRTYPPQLLAAYLEGEFVNMTAGAVYPTFSRTENHTDETIQPGEPLHIGVDFNVYNCTAVILTVRGGQPRVLGELTKMIDTPDVIRTIRQRFDGHPITVYPDASGNSDKTVNASQTDISLLRQARFEVRVPTRNPFIKDRIMAVSALILNGKGERHLRVNTRLAPTVTEALEQQVYDANGLPDKTSGHDHAADGLGYVCNVLWPVVRPQAAQVRLVGL